ncbi:MAG: hypothetical protein WKF43_03350 [Acidimicrobiales bacterium]
MAWLSPRGARVGLAVVLALVAGAVVVVAAPSPVRGYLAVLVAAGLLLIGAGAGWRRSGLVGVALVCLGSAFVLGHLESDGIPGLVVLVAPLLFASSEQAHWSMDLVTPVHDEPGVHLARWIWWLASVAVAVVLSTLLVRAAGMRLEVGLPLAPLGVVASLSLLGLGVALARRGPSA